MPITAKKHFDDDINRAWNIYKNAQQQLSAQGSDIKLCNDLMLSAVAMSVGAMDAYLCDAYVDCLSSALRAYAQGKWPGSFPGGYKKQLLPAGEVLNSARANRPLWSIRMAARKVMERENILSISKIDDLFNPILPTGKKLWHDFIASLIAHNRIRFTQHTQTTISSLKGKNLDDAKKKAVTTLKSRVAYIVQLRHDWIHNCSRPKSSITKLTKLKALSAIRDIHTLIDELDKHIENNRIV
jgi:hypothetical protein